METKMEKSSTRAARKRGSLEGGLQKEKYLKLKAFAIEHEKENFSKLFIIHEIEMRSHIHLRNLSNC